MARAAERSAVLRSAVTAVKLLNDEVSPCDELGGVRQQIYSPRPRFGRSRRGGSPVTLLAPSDDLPRRHVAHAVAVAVPLEADPLAVVARHLYLKPGVHALGAGGKSVRGALDLAVLDAGSGGGCG